VGSPCGLPWYIFYIKNTLHFPYFSLRTPYYIYNFLTLHFLTRLDIIICPKNSVLNALHVARISPSYHDEAFSDYNHNNNGRILVYSIQVTSFSHSRDSSRVNLCSTLKLLRWQLTEDDGWALCFSIECTCTCAIIYPSSSLSIS
jgi:hypothetical protein